MFLYYRALMAVSSGLLLAVGFIIPYLWLAMLVGLVPLLFLVADSDTGTKRLFAYSCLAGAVFMGIELSWLWQSIPLNWLGVEDFWPSALAVLAAWLPLTTISAITIGLWAILFRWLRTGQLLDLLVAPSIWVLLEFARAIIFNLAFLGQGSVLGPHFSFGFVGYLLANNPVLLQWASVGGVWALSFVVVCVNVVFYNILTNWHKLSYIKISLHIGIVALIYATGLAMLHQDGSGGATFKVAAVYTNVESRLDMPDDERERRLASVVSLIKDSAREDADIIIIPGGPNVYANLLRDGQWDTFLQETFNGKESLLVDTGISQDPYGQKKNRLYYINTKTGDYTNSEKVFLLPDGEYLPYWHKHIARLLGIGTLADTISTRRELARGSLAQATNFKGTMVSTLFCSEVMSPLLYRDATARGANILLNESSYAWFHGTANIAYQMQLFAKVRAVENSRPYAQASNMSPAFILDINGNVVEESSRGEEGVIYASLYATDNTTPYTKFGLHVLWILLFTTLSAVCYRRYTCG